MSSDDVVECDLVFVYGTLKHGEPNHNWITDTKEGEAEFVCNALTVQKFPLVIASRYNIPYLLNAPGTGNNVEGEVYKVNGKMLSHLDVLESHPKYYKREIHEVVDSSNSEEGVDRSRRLKVWVYLLHSFKPAMLELPHRTVYLSQGDHGLPYVARYLRADSDYYWSDVKVV